MPPRGETRRAVYDAGIQLEKFPDVSSAARLARAVAGLDRT